jgi:voltage-gated potassium channel
MKFLTTQISYFLNQNQIRRNINALLKYVLFVFGVIVVHTILFHVIMIYAEGRDFSWITGLYWTLTVMSTLGFGDITFESDVGRLFSIVVLLSGIVLLLIMLPFAFIRFFYAPWIEAQIHVQCPRAAPPGTTGHVIICRYDSIAPNLIKRLRHRGIPYFVIEPDSSAAIHLFNEGVSVVHGELDDRSTYELLLVRTARLIFANAADTTNTNITLTIREIAPDVPIIAAAENEDSIDILELSGATKVFPLKQMLGESLANRINAGGERVHIVRKLDDWLVAEFTVHNTSLEGSKVRDTHIRESTGANIVGIWEKGVLLPFDPDKTLSDSSVPVVVGKAEQISKLEELLSRNESETLPESVLVIGGGKVGCAAASALKQKGVTVFIVDCLEELREGLSKVADRVTIGDAADLETITRGGLNEASLVILSTNDDAVNIYLSIYCRRLNPALRIVSRITHEQNLEAIHRAGADFVLSYATLGAESVISVLHDREPVIMGEEVEFFTVDLPPQLAGQTLTQSSIGALTGLVVLAVESGGHINFTPSPSTVLTEGSQLTVLGTPVQLAVFRKHFE